jgi:anaerobic selenocysteine-containing dehydrogenase
MKTNFPKIIDRREFLKLTGLSLAGMTFIELPFNKLLRIGPAEPGWKPFIEKTVTTVCQLCSGACGIKVRTIDGYPVSISGNPYHPVSKGHLCPKGLSALQSYYHPARIDNPKILHDGKSTSVSWDKAIQEIGHKIKGILDEGRPERIAFIHNHLSGLSYKIIEKFMDQIGSRNLISFDGDEAIKLANYFTFGNYQQYACDIGNSNFILSFGSQLLDAWDSPLFAQDAISGMRADRKYAQLIQVESRFSTTAARANEWIPIQPGTEGALALGMAYVIIKEELFDSAFVKNHTFGFDGNNETSDGSFRSFKELVLGNYHPEIVARITGVELPKIIQLAKSFADLKPSIALPGKPVTEYHNGLFNAMAINALNALLGNIDKPGGVLKQRKLSYPGFESSDRQSKKPIISLTKDFYDNLPSLDMLFIYNNNPAYNNPLPEKFIRWMKEIPVTVNFSSVWDETASISTYVLPEHHFLDRWQDVVSSEVFPHPVIGLSQPIGDKALHNTKHLIDIFSGLIFVLGGSLKSEFLLSPSEKMVKEYFQNIYNARNGTVFADEFYTRQIKKLEEMGWWSDPYGSFSDFWGELKSKGGWWDPAYTFEEWGRIFASSSGRYEFFSQNLARIIGDLPRKSNITDITKTPPEIIPLPHHEKNIFDSNSRDYPFHLNVYEPISFNRGTGGDLPWLLENPTAPVAILWETWVEINPDTAIRLKINDNDTVIIESAHGKVEAVARYLAAAKPDVVSVPIGLGRKSFHRDIPSIGSNILEIVSPITQLFTGKPALLSTMVRIYKK